MLQHYWGHVSLHITPGIDIDGEIDIYIPNILIQLYQLVKHCGMYIL